MGQRLAAHHDLDALAGLWRELIDHHAAADLRPRLRSSPQSELTRRLAVDLTDASTTLRVWEEGGDLLGFVVARIEETGEPAPRGEILDLYVRSGQRRRGIGRGLVATGLDWLRERGAGRVVVSVAAGNAEGQAFWRALGFGPFVDVLERRL